MRVKRRPAGPILVSIMSVMKPVTSRAGVTSKAGLAAGLPGALVTANAPEEQRPQVFSALMKWGMSMAVIAPVATWALFVVPGQG